MGTVVQLNPHDAEDRLDELAAIADEAWSAVERNTEVAKNAVIEAHRLLAPSGGFKAWLGERKIPKSTAYLWVGPSDIVHSRRVRSPAVDFTQDETVQYDPTDAGVCHAITGRVKDKEAAIEDVEIKKALDLFEICRQYVFSLPDEKQSLFLSVVGLPHL